MARSGEAGQASATHNRPCGADSWSALPMVLIGFGAVWESGQD